MVRRAIPNDTLYFLARVLGAVPRTFGTFPRELSSRRLGRSHRPRRVERREETADDRSMPTTARPQQRYDHRLRHLVQRTGDVTVATDLGVPRSTARGWLGAAPTVVVCLDVADLTEPELRQEVLKLRRRVQKLTALLRLALALLRSSGFTLTQRASARRTRQDQDPPRRGSGPRVCAVAGAPAVPAIVAESVPCLAPAAARVCA